MSVRIGGGGRSFRLWGTVMAGVVLVAGLFWIGAIPWTTYAPCGISPPTSLPSTVRVGLYEEFPSSARLVKLRHVDFPVSLAVAATSRAEFIRQRDAIDQSYPEVHEVFFWPLLTRAEGYYPGTWSDPAAVRRAAGEADGLPVLWDLELPRDTTTASPQGWWQNRAFLDQWLRKRTEPTHLWRSTTFLGLDSALLRLSALQFDPRDYPSVSMHLDLYTTGKGLPDPLLRRVLRCGVERYAGRFIPSFGVLNDGEGPAEAFLPIATLRRYLGAARETGVGEVWLFGSNGLSDEVVEALRNALPVAPAVARHAG